MSLSFRPSVVFLLMSCCALVFNGASCYHYQVGTNVNQRAIRIDAATASDTSRRGLFQEVFAASVAGGLLLAAPEESWASGGATAGRYT
jgi:hypothetical protein